MASLVSPTQSDLIAVVTSAVNARFDQFEKKMDANWAAFMKSTDAKFRKLINLVARRNGDLHDIKRDSGFVAELFRFRSAKAQAVSLAATRKVCPNANTAILKKF